MKYIALLIAIGWSLWFPVHVIKVLNDNPVMVQGPGSDIVKTTGVFEPGGYINIDMNTGIKSVNGYHHSVISFIPTIAGTSNNEITSWATVQKEVNAGWPWESGINVSNTGEVVKFNVVLDIPDDISLKGKTVNIKMVAQVTYPQSTSMATFQNITKTVEDDFEIIIGSTDAKQLSAWSRYWHERKQHKAPYWPVIIWIWLLPTFWYMYVLAKNTSKKHSVTSRITQPGGASAYRQQPGKPDMTDKSQKKEVIIKDNLCLKCSKRNTGECPYGQNTQCIGCSDFKEKEK